MNEFSTKKALDIANNLYEVIANNNNVSNIDIRVILFAIDWIKKFVKQLNASKIQEHSYKTLEKLILLDLFSMEIKKVKKIFRLSCDYILKEINYKKQTLEIAVEKLIKFPIEQKKTLDKLDIEVSKNISFKYLKRCDLSYVHNREKNIFHLVLSKVDHLDKIKELNFSQLEGSQEIFSLTDYAYILKIYFEASLTHQKTIVNIIDAVKWARAFALKVASYSSRYNCNNETKLFDYYSSLYHIYPVLDKLKNNKFLKNKDRTSLEKFVKKFSLDKNNLIHNKILINNLAHDLKNMVNDLLPHQPRFFYAGVIDHALIIEICLDPRNPLYPEGEYVLTVYNTGDGTKNHANVPKGSNTYKPFIVRGLNKKNLSYEFFKQLMLIMFKEYDINLLYELLRSFLIQDADGYICLHHGKSYHIQLYETCVYDCLDVFLNHHLQEEELQRIHFIKTALALKYQTEIIRRYTSTTPSQFLHSLQLFDLAYEQYEYAAQIMESIDLQFTTKILEILK